MLTLFKPTGEVRPPIEGEWYWGTLHKKVLQAQWNYMTSYPILTCITADTWEELKEKVEEGKK